MIPLGVIQQQAVSAGLSCAYPLDDDGTLAASFGYGYAGPATGAGQQGLSFTSSASGQSILTAANALGTARFSRPASGKSVFELQYVSGTVQYIGCMITISDAGGALINSAFVVQTTPSLGAVTVASDGTVGGLKDNVLSTLSWYNGAGQKTVGPTDKYAIGIFVQATAAGQTATGDLRTFAGDMTGTYTAGETDPCGNVI